MRIQMVALSAALVVAACSGGASSGTGTAVPTPSMSVPSASPARPTPGPTEPFAIFPGPMEPGRYLQTGISPQVSFVLGPDWQAYFADADGVYLGYLNGVEMGINRPERIVDPVSNRAADSPADLAAWLAANPTFDAVKRSTIKIDGLRATRIEGAAKRDQDLFAYASGNYHTVTGLRYRFYVLQLDGPDLVILQAGPLAAIEAASPALDDIVDSLRIGAS